MVKPGDVVFMPLYVAGVQNGAEVLMAANPWAAEDGRGIFAGLDTEVFPYHDALPAIALWLQERPDGIPLDLFDYLDAAIDEEPDVAYRWQLKDELAVLRSLAEAASSRS